MLENQNFGVAIEALKQGKRITREGWNGKSMFVFQRPSDVLPVDMVVNQVKSLPKAVKDYFREVDANSVRDNGEGLKTVSFTAYLCLKATDGSIVNGWFASQTDILANDWCILD